MDGYDGRRLKRLGQIEREKGIPRKRQRGAIHAGELRAVCTGLRVMFTTDEWIDDWLRSKVVRVGPSAAARAAKVAEKIAKT